MVRLLLALVCTLVTAASAQISQPQASVPCDAFVKHANGCWSPTRQVTINTSSGNGSISPGMTFRTGTLFMGNLPEMLNQQCLVRSFNQSEMRGSSSLTLRGNKLLDVRGYNGNECFDGPGKPVRSVAVKNGHSFNGQIESQVLCRFPQYYFCSSA